MDRRSAAGPGDEPIEVVNPVAGSAGRQDQGDEAPLLARASGTADAVEAALERKLQVSGWGQGVH